MLPSLVAFLLLVGAQVLVHSEAIAQTASPKAARNDVGLNYAASPQDLSVRAGENDSVYYYSPDQIRVQAGVIRVTFINEGARQHTFNIKRQDEWRDLYNFPLVQSGESSVFEFELWEPGTYVFFCQLYKHVDHGQTGVINAPG